MGGLPEPRPAAPSGVVDLRCRAAGARNPSRVGTDPGPPAEPGARRPSTRGGGQADQPDGPRRGRCRLADAGRPRRGAARGGNRPGRRDQARDRRQPVLRRRDPPPSRRGGGDVPGRRRTLGADVIPGRSRPAAEHPRGGDEQGGAAGRRDRLTALDRGGDRPRLRPRTPRRRRRTERGRGPRPTGRRRPRGAPVRGAIARAVHLRPLARQQHALRRSRRDPAGPDPPPGSRGPGSDVRRRRRRALRRARLALAADDDAADAPEGGRALDPGRGAGADRPCAGRGPRLVPTRDRGARPDPGGRPRASAATR